MSPFRDTMCLIHCVKRDFDAFQKVHVLCFLQALRSQIEQFGFASQYVFFDGIDLGTRKRRIDEMGYARFVRVVAHGIHLVLHQRNKRRYDDGHAVHNQRWQLVAQTLATARRHQHKRVVPLHNVAYNGFLVTFETVKTKVALQCFGQLFVSYVHLLYINI